MSSSTRRRLSRARTLDLLHDLERAEDSATSIYFSPGSSVAEIEVSLRSESGPIDMPIGLAEAITRSSTGAALFWGEQHKYLVLPPFPISAEGTTKGYHIEPLRSLLQKEFTIALVLVRLGAYAIGVFQGERLLCSKVGTGLVHSRHRKGGSSAHRFERHRQKQMEVFFSRICNRVREQVEPYVSRLDYAIYGGERNTVNSFRKQCRFLKLVDNCTVEHLLNIREPRQATLEAAIGDAWSSTLMQWWQD